MKKRNLHSLSDDIDKKLEQINKSDRKKDSVNIGTGTKIATDLIGLMFVSIMIGVFLDKHFKTGPLLLSISLCIGIAASIKNIIAILKKKNAQ